VRRECLTAPWRAWAWLSDFLANETPKADQISKIGSSFGLERCWKILEIPEIHYRKDVMPVGCESRVQVIIHRFIGRSTCRNLKLVLEGATYAVNDEVPLEMSNLSADNAPIFPCDYGECPFVNWAWPYHCEEAAIHYYGMTIEYILSDVALVRLIWMWVREAVNFSIEHGITIVKESSSITIQWYDNGKREWLQLPLLVAGYKSW